MAEKEQVISALRATLISVKGALTIKQCNRDYRELQGEWIPFKKLGYPSLEKLFLDVPGFKVNQINGDWYVDAIASQDTQHIATMVARQKSSKKAGPKISYPSRFPKRQDSWRKPSSTSDYKTNYNNQLSKQYYRAKFGTSYNHNNTVKYNKYNKSNDFKSIQYETKQNISQSDSRNTTLNSKQYNNKIANDYSDTKNGSNAPATVTQQVTLSSEPIKHPASNESENGSKRGKVSASQRLFNLRDRFNSVDLIPLQLPSITNEFVESTGPVINVAPASSLEPPPDFASSVAKLEWTCRKLGLPQPVFKVLDLTPKRGPVCYGCSVKVGSQYKESSYPDSAPSEELAREVAAVKLLSTIESSEAGGLPTSSDSKAVASLANLVSEHEAGLWANTVPHLYREKYSENLPNNWQELLESCPRIIKERVVNGWLVLLPNKEDSETPPLERTIFDDTIDNDLPPLQFPDDIYWNAYVTVANSTIEIWLRIIGTEYSGIFEQILEEMSDYYDRYGTTVDKSMIIVNAWYAVYFEDEGWQRAKILEIGNETATVFLGDHGDDDIVPLNNIKILEPQFRKLPAQAILCRLEGAEELAASSAAGALVRRRLQAVALVAAPGPRDDPSEPAVSVVLFDTTTAKDVNLNKEIIHDFCISGAFSITQKLCEVEVGCVTDEGQVWVSRAGGPALVTAALALITTPGPYRRPLPASPPAPPPPPLHARDPPLFIVRTFDGDWVRCTIISGLDGEGTVRTLLIDSGLVLRAPLSSLVPLQTFSPALNAFPHQAVQVRLGEAERAAVGMTSRLRELLLNTQVLCRALPSPGEAPTAPNVELFVRTGPRNMLASVNNDILMQYDLLGGKPKEVEEDTTNRVEALNRKKERIFGSSSSSSAPAAAVTAAAAAGGAAAEDALRPPRSAVARLLALIPRSPLPPPDLPDIEKCFDVFISMAASPWNFVVQPNSTRGALREMMASLQKECPNLSEADAPENPAPGELYTMLYEKDSSWYRVIIARAVTVDTVSVHFCDFGDLALVEFNVLRRLPKTVPLAHKLPPQAIKARLYDVLPLYHDWTVEDCIRFQELCVEQQFVGICKEVGRDPLSKDEILVTLDLIDTSTDEDIYLNKQLVTEGRARLASASQ